MHVALELGKQELADRAARVGHRSHEEKLPGCGPPNRGVGRCRAGTRRPATPPTREARGRGHLALAHRSVRLRRARARRRAHRRIRARARSARSRRSARASRDRVDTRAPVSRSASVPSTPSRAADQRFSSIRQVGASGSVSPASWRSASHAASALDEGRHRGGPGDRRLGVRNAELERSEQRMRPQLPPPAPRLGHHRGSGAPAQRAGEVLPARDRGRQALPRKQLSDRRSRRGKARVRAGVEGRIGGEGGELRQVPAQAVVHGERAVGAAARPRAPGARPRAAGGRPSRTRRASARTVRRG